MVEARFAFETDCENPTKQRHNGDGAWEAAGANNARLE